MKLKNIVTSKPFIAGSLTVLCVGILTVCLILQGNEKTEFIPAPSSSEAPVESWSENPSPTESGKEIKTSDNVATSTPKNEEYPKVEESDDNKTVVDFTDPSPEKPETPPAPEGKTEIADPGSSHPVQKDTAVTPTPSKQQPKKETKQESKPSTPAPGSKNEQGQIYDPVFGWITPSDVQQETIDGDGDPEKMIGEMN